MPQIGKQMPHTNEIPYVVQTVIFHQFKERRNAALPAALHKE